MGLKITSKKDKKVFIKNTNIEINEVYVRVGWEAFPTGEHVKVTSMHYYQSKQKFLEDSKNTIPVDVKLPLNSQIGLVLEVEKQNWDKVGDALVDEFDNAGYECEIFDENE